MDDSYFADRYAHDPRRRPVWREIAAWIDQDIGGAESVLELGAGYCDFINQFPAKKKAVVDLYEGVREFAAEGVEVHVGPCHDLSMFEANAFDLVFASNLFEHLTHETFAQTLSEVKRVLRPGGRLAAIQPNFQYCAPHYFDDHTHRLIFTHTGLAGALHDAGFKIETIRPRFLPFSFKSRLPAWPWLARLYLRLPVRPLAKQMYICAVKP